jgi:hypothetical protein
MTITSACIQLVFQGLNISLFQFSESYTIRYKTNQSSRTIP